MNRNEMRLLDLFCGRWGWSKAFAARGWECIGVDLVEIPEIPIGCRWIGQNVLRMWSKGEVIYYEDGQEFWREIKPDFIVASPPCEEFSIHGMKHFFLNPKYPENGIRLFNHTRQLCESSGLPYIMENVRAAQQFVGNAVHHCGPFYLWGNAVPPLLNQGITKGYKMNRAATLLRSRRKDNPFNPHTVARNMATIPPELANCVADYAERLLEQKRLTGTND